MKLGLYPRIYFRELSLVLLAWSFLNFRWLDYLLRFKGSYALISILLSAGIIFWLKKIKNDKLPLFFLERKHLPSFMWWVLISLALVPIGLVVGLVTFNFNLARILFLPVVFLGIFFTVGLVEELVFRQVVLVFFEQRWGISVAVVASSLLFGLSHIVRGPFPNWSYVWLAILAGLIYGIVFYRYGLFYAIILHSIVDVFKFTFLGP